MRIGNFCIHSNGMYNAVKCSKSIAAPRLEHRTFQKGFTMTFINPESCRVGAKGVPTLPGYSDAAVGGYYSVK